MSKERRPNSRFESTLQCPRFDANIKKLNKVLVFTEVLVRAPDRININVPSVVIGVVAKP